MANRVTKQFQPFSQRASDGVIADPINVAHAKTVTVAMGAANGSALDVKCQGSVGSAAATFGTAASQSNMWDYIGMYDLNSALHVAGDTGVTLGSNEVRIFEVNVNAINWLSFEVDNYSSGSVTLEVIRVDNQ